MKPIANQTSATLTFDSWLEKVGQLYGGDFCRHCARELYESDYTPAQFAEWLESDQNVVPVSMVKKQATEVLAVFVTPV